MTFLVLDQVISDRGSRYAVSGGPVAGRAGIDAALAGLKREKRFAKATHNSWACVFSDDGPVKNDDGETGAGAVILKMLERAGLVQSERESRLIHYRADYAGMRRLLTFLMQDCCQGAPEMCSDLMAGLTCEPQA